ncbi:MAG: hypothetical protein CM15mP103_05750 [Gammaproteobacteria bacterium]|nr:MAG: hypothetical protein CM15mP103_05750 [Gammaproteobacteria bacterium]
MAGYARSIEDHLYLCTPFNRILAIHAETGAERWSYSPNIDLESFPMPRCRGVTQWTDERVPPTDPAIALSLRRSWMRGS